MQHNITDPHQHGIDTRHVRNRKLVRALDRAVEQLNSHWVTRGARLKIASITGMNQGRGQGMEM